MKIKHFFRSLCRLRVLRLAETKKTQAEAAPPTTLGASVYNTRRESR
jgi:hypothetical protein